MPPIIPGPNSDVVPAGDAAAESWLVNLSAQFTIEQFDIVAPSVASVATAVGSYVAALAAATNPATRTAPAVAAKDLAKQSAIALVRPVVQQLVALFAEGTVLGSNLETFGIRIPKATRTPINSPVTWPILGAPLLGPGTIRMRASDSETPDARARPFGSIGLELYRVVSPSAPPDGDGGEFIGLFTRQPMNVDSPPAIKGMAVHYFARWLTGKGLTGPWSLALSTVGT